MQIHIDDGILELVGTSDSRAGGWVISKPHFIVNAVVIGTTNLYVSLHCSCYTFRVIFVVPSF